MATYSNSAREVEMPDGNVVVLHSEPTGGANTTSNIKKFKYDDNGHVTESTAADAEDLNLSSYSTPTTGTTAIGTSDDVQTAIGKLDHQSHIDQTNILYTLETGVKNWMPVDHANLSAEQYLFRNHELALPAGDYIFYLNVSSATATGANFIASNGLDDGTNRTADVVIQPITTGINTANVTVAAGTTHISLFINGAVNIPEIMLCPKQIWDTMNHDFQPSALPNYDLTQLEQEDRNALVEVVDKGAKNLYKYDIETIKSFNNTFTWNNNVGTSSDNHITITLNSDNTIRVASDGSNAQVEFKIGSNAITALTAGANYVLSGCPSGGSATKYDQRLIFVTTPNTYIQDCGSGESFTCPNATYSHAIVIRANQSLNTIFKPMICTQADWRISQNYAPFALPNTDLTRMMTPFFTVPINHNMIYRGQNLGDTLTADQDTALSSGNFTDLYLGDYWTKTVTIPAFYEVTTAEPSDWSTNYTSYYTKSGDTYTPVSGDTAPTWAANTYYTRLVTSQTVTLKAVIADFDTFYAGYASSYAGINTHHAAVIVTGFNNVVWNSTNTTAGGYVASLIHKWLVGSALPQIETWFGSAKVLSHQKLLTNAITGDAASGWAWSSQKISLLSENQMYGSKVWGNSKATNGGYEPGEAFKHLNVFNHIDANLLFGNKNIWLRDIASAVLAACLYYVGSADIAVASSSWIAPAALILLS